MQADCPWTRARAAPADSDTRRTDDVVASVSQLVVELLVTVERAAIEKSRDDEFPGRNAHRASSRRMRQQVLEGRRESVPVACPDEQSGSARSQRRRESPLTRMRQRACPSPVLRAAPSQVPRGNSAARLRRSRHTSHAAPSGANWPRTVTRSPSSSEAISCNKSARSDSAPTSAGPANARVTFNPFSARSRALMRRS